MDNMVLQKVWQQGQRLTVDDLSGCAFTGENAAHTFEISGKNASGAVAISGTIAGKFLRSDNVTVPVTGTASDGVASITLTEDCYAVPGRFIFSVYANDGTHNICIYCGVGNVLRTDSGEHEGGEIITDVTALINAIETAVATIPADYSTLLSAIAPTFSASTAYAAGSYVWYDGNLYKFTADHAAGSWTGTDAVSVSLAGDLGAQVIDLKSATNNIDKQALGYLPLTWEQGTITSSGVGPSPNLIRTTESYNVSTGDLIVYSIADGYAVRPYLYKQDDTQNGNMGDFTGSGVINISTADTAKVKFRINKTPTATEILPSEGYSAFSARVFGHVLHDEVTPQMYGAVGDGVTDDTAAFQAAIMSGKNVYVPTSNNETYKITASLDVVNSCKRIYGDILPSNTSSNASIVFDLSDYSGDPSDVALFKFTYGAQAISIAGLFIKSVKVGGVNVGVCIDATKFVYGQTVMPDKDITLNNVTIVGFNKSIAMTGRGCNALGCTFSECVNIGVFNWIGNYSDSNTAHPKQYNQRGISFKSCRFHSFEGAAVVIETGHAYGLMICNCTADTGKGTFLQANEEGWNWNISNNIIQGQTDTCLKLDGGIKNSVISGNVISRDSDFWVNTSRAMPENHIVLFGAHGCVISGNALNGCTADSVIVDGYKAALTWAQGNLTSSGESDSNNLIRTTNYLEIPDGATINVEFDDTVYGARAVVFDSPSMDATSKQNYIFSSSVKSYTNSTGATRYLRFRLERVPTAAILPAVGNQALAVIATKSNGVAITGNTFDNVTGYPVSMPYAYDNVSKVGNVDTQGRTP